MGSRPIPLDDVVPLWRARLSWREIAEAINRHRGMNVQATGVANAVRRAIRAGDRRFYRPRPLLSLPKSEDRLARRRRAWFVYCRIRRLAMRMEREHEQALRRSYA